MTAPRFIGSEIYRGSSYGAWHPLRIPRVSTVMDLSRALGWFREGQYLTSPRAKPAALEGWHTPDYVAALQAAEDAGGVADEVRARHGLGTVSNPVFPEMFRRPATSVGGTLLAGELLRDGGIVHTPAGGTHHAFPDRAAGFCYFNDPVFAILSLRAHGARRVAYVDIDAHHPDGVEHAFARDMETLMISIHEEGRWPFTGALEDRGAGDVWNLPVPRGFDDTGMRMALEDLIGPRIAEFRPDAIVLQSGSDGVEEDPLSRLAMSNNAHWSVVAALKRLAPRFLVLGGGGYNPWAVGRLWTGNWAVLNGYEIPDRLPAGAEAVLRGLTWERASRGRNPPAHWFETLRDVPREGPVQPEVRERLKALSERAKVWA